MDSMDSSSIGHLLWGVLLISCRVVLISMDLPLLKLCSPLTLSQTTLLIFIGEATSLLPFVGVIWKEWSVVRRNEWIAIGSLCAMLAACFVVDMYCSKVMIHGTLINTCPDIIVPKSNECHIITGGL